MHWLGAKFAEMWGGLKHAACCLGLINRFDTSRVHCPSASDPIPKDGIAIALSALNAEHSGIYYEDMFGRVHVLHLMSHRNIANDDPVNTPEFIWIVPRIRPKRAIQIAELCALIAANKPLIDYGFAYDEASIFSLLDASFSAATGTTGLTCATFVLAILRSNGIRLIATNSWRATPDGVRIQAFTANRMFPSDASNKGRLRSEIGANRFTPAQVAGAGMHCRENVKFESADGAGAIAMQRLFDYYIRDNLI